MLRLNASSISLDKKDLDFHQRTHKRRQAARGHSRSSLNFHQRHSEGPRSIRGEQISSVLSPISNSTNSLVNSPIHEQQDEDSIISRDPVPRNSKAFWDRVLAEAGTPTRVQATESGNGRIVDPLEDWLGDHHSIRASIGDDRNLDIKSQDSLEDIRHHHSSLGSVRSSPKVISNAITKRKGVTASLESIRQATKQSRFSNLFRRRPRSVDAVEEVQQTQQVDLGLDGHNSEMQHGHERESSTSSGASRAFSSNDGLYGSRRDRRTISERLGSSMTEMPTNDASVRLEGTTSERARRSFLMLPVANLLSLPPRRPRTYRPRSETYSYEVSEASSAITQIESRQPVTPSRPSQRQRRSRNLSQIPHSPDEPQNASYSHEISESHSHTPISPLQASLGTSQAVIHHPQQVSIEINSHRATSNNTSISNTSFNSSHSSLSPFALPFHPRIATPQHQLPPPFGATPRTVSYSHALPTSSSPLPATPPLSSFRVYNDAEPRQTQPQTPADLHRRRRLRFHNTVPTRGPAHVELGIARWQAFASPPRPGRTPTRLRPEVIPVRMEEVVSLDIENGDTITSLERERRRAWNSGRRLGREEWRGLDLSPGLMSRGAN